MNEAIEERTGYFVEDEAETEWTLPLIMTRRFAVSRERMWEAWTNKDHLMQWFAPRAFLTRAVREKKAPPLPPFGHPLHHLMEERAGGEKAPGIPTALTRPQTNLKRSREFRMAIDKLDVSAGGTFDYLLRSESAAVVRGRFSYREVVVPERLLFVSSFSDERGNPIASPFLSKGPLEVLCMITFSEHRARTSVTLRFVPTKTTPAQRKSFVEAREALRRSWTGVLDQLGGFLAKD